MNAMAASELRAWVRACVDEADGDRQDLPPIPVEPVPADPFDEDTHPGYLAADVSMGEHLVVILPDGTVRTAVVLAAYKGGSVQIDYIDRVAQLRAHQATTGGSR